MRKSLILGLALLVALSLAACSGKSDDNNTKTKPAPDAAAETIEPATGVYRILTIDEFADIVANRSSDYTIINVHIPYAGEIEGTDADIPYNDVDALTAALPDKIAPIILYCRSGRMSEEASRALIDLGYTQVWDVPGGMNAWQSSGRELINK